MTKDILKLLQDNGWKLSSADEPGCFRRFQKQGELRRWYVTKGAQYTGATFRESRPVLMDEFNSLMGV